VKPLGSLVRDTRARGTALPVSRAKLSHAFLAFPSPPRPSPPPPPPVLPPAPALFLPRAPRPWADSSSGVMHMQAGQCDSQMGTKFLEVLCDECGISGGGKYCGDNDAQLGRINVFLPRGLGRQVQSPRGAHESRARRDRRCNTKSPIGELFCPENSVNQSTGALSTPSCFLCIWGVLTRRG
jgi:hypothetical protein